MRRRWVYLAPLALVGIVLFVALGGQVVHLLWNWLLPPLFGFSPITFWQALGILVLCRILFRSGFRRRMAARWEQMTPEERERFRQGMRGCGPASDVS